MSTTRNNHYVPQWYQKEFFETGRNTLAYLDMKPCQTVLDDGRVIIEKSFFPHDPTSRMFQQRDLYSTFFGTGVNDEIERRLFGNFDTKGSRAIRAFAGSDIGEWHHNFLTLFEYIDVQKIRTPKGLDWLKAQYPTLSQNELMAEMQGIRMMHCTIWTEGVREIVSAEDADVKFLVSDHPVTIYNHAVPPESKVCIYPNDPSIALKASQTIFPLNRNFCLILTNLEYARDPSTSPLDKRTFARNFRQSMIRTDALIRKRKLSSKDVERINYVLKARACRYIAAGRKEWLYPETTVSESWGELQKTLLPPESELWNFGGEMYMQFKDGHVHYQDEFGRTEKQRDFLKKDPPTEPLRPSDLCGCGYGRTFGECCASKPVALRPTWNERSIRERNLMLHNAIVNVLGLGPGKNWTQIRRDLTDDQISEIYSLFEGLWPIETDLLSLLPKPDGTARAVYTGSIHPETIQDLALGALLYFGEMIVAHRFLHAGSVKKELSPVENPRPYRLEFLKTLRYFFTVMPLVELGLVNLIPDPCSFDVHLHHQMLNMAKSRSSDIEIDPSKEPRMVQLMKRERQRVFMSMPRDALRSQLFKAQPGLDVVGVEREIRKIEQLKERDPLAVLQESSLRSGERFELFNMMRVAPNFEMAMYLAQATGACIVTDSYCRWTEIRRAIRHKAAGPSLRLTDLSREIERSKFAFPQNLVDIATFAHDKTVRAYPALFEETIKYLSSLSDGELTPKQEPLLVSRFAKTHAPAQAALKKARIPVKKARISCVFASEGIQDNTVNRLLLMSSSERHLPSVPMAFFIEGIVTE